MDAVNSMNARNVLEIGPGEGVLTQHLIITHPDLHVVEIDRESIAYLKQHLPQLEDRLHEADILNWEIPNGDWLIVGNFPYNISSQIIFKAIENRDQVVGLVGMFQKEVAERIVSEPGSKVYGIISVLTQAFYDGEYLFTVNESAFRPPPKVKSGVIRLVRKANATLNCDHPFFVMLVKQSFNQRRKMLRNTLKQYLSEPIPDEVKPYLTMRPEQLHYTDFVKLAQQLKP